MHECLLCERDMKKSKNEFGNGCINNIYKFLDIEKPTRGKNKELFLYKNIMQRTNISKINKEQKIWLADRYLTYQYLDKLKYGNFEKLKKQINEDIENVDKIEKFEEMITARKIKLKEAYDLYKKETKFKTNLAKIENNEYKEDENIKLLITGFSYIFNMYKNKNQYEKNSFKAMQYAFWQTVIEVGGRYFKYKLAAKLLQHSLEKNPKDFIIKDEKIINLIIRDENFKNKIKEILDKYNKQQNFYISQGKESMAFKNSDLYFAIHKANIEMKAEKNEDSSWKADITLSDTFDFTKFKTPLDYYFDANNIPKSILSSTLYNLAFISQKLGVIKEYNVIAKLTIKIQKNGEIEML